MGQAATAFIAVEDYLQMEQQSTERHEYYSGVILDMAGGSLMHNRVVSNISREIGSRIAAAGCDVFTSDMRVCTPLSDTYMYPDVAIVCEEPVLNKTNGLDTLTNPSVIFEVLSPSTEDKDRGYKFFRYIQIPSLKEYIMVNSSCCEIDLVQKQTDGTWKISKLTNMDDVIRLETIGVDLLVSAVYFRVEW